MIIVVFYVSYNYSSSVNTRYETPVGQEYLVKNTTVGPNSTVVVAYYDNDKNMTEKIMVSTGINQLVVVKTNSSVSTMILEKRENNVNYWKVYMSETAYIKNSNRGKIE